MNRRPLLISVILLSACVSGFKQFYTEAPISSNITLAPFSGSTKISSSDDLNGDGMRLRENGYVLLGVASFETGGRVTTDQMNDRAKELGADIVLWSNKYMGTQQSAMVLPDVTTTNTFGSVGGTSFHASSSTLGTEVVPISIRRYAWTATFWRKAQSYVLGIYAVNLPDDLRQQLQRNGGIVVRVVVEESPAFKANILPGDVIIKINDHDVYSIEQSSRVLSTERGKASIVTLIRSGETKSIPVTLNP